ncbi:D-2-hydroxyacid dehydrogenase [uncultured Pseudomonas sp.]|uniref:D-2-hydroxyacid dehydrogenase n=1 Tax=uncultured Pseudomonas sp. TaxID=114707 RepID=UPI0025E09DAC|nr:D-2-hydroxyacid dehydrogenase [uncultured Pseudomonas sp.]
MTAVLLLESEPAGYVDAWQAQAPGLDLRVARDLAEAECLAGGTCYWLGQPDRAADLLRRGAKPTWLQSTWAGYAPLLAADLPCDYRFSRAVGLFGQSIGEYVLTYLLQHERQVAARQLSQRERRWDTRAPGTLAGRRLLLVGAGDIGQDIARLFAPFGLSITGVARSARTIPGFARVVPLTALQEAAAAADFVVNLLPDSPSTRDLYDADFFAALPAGALFINAGRGTSVVDAALIAALESGQLGGAVLDVFRQEPLPAEHPFWQAPNLQLTAHVAGPTPPAAAVQLFLDNLQRLQQELPLRGAVDLAAQPRV